MNKVRIDPKEYPLKQGESWWKIHPNSGNVEFLIPRNAAAVCINTFLFFESGHAYDIISHDRNDGWITVLYSGAKSQSILYEMPEYIFVRHFDSECFVRGIVAPERLENAKPFEYRPTVPMRPHYEFKDTHPEPIQYEIVWDNMTKRRDD